MESLREDIFHQEILPRLPEEIIHEEILARLPVKSLLRFRCIAKSWSYLIDSERFTKTHLNQISIQNAYLLHHRVILKRKCRRPKQCSLQSFLSENPPINRSRLDDPTNTPKVPYQVLGSYNGLVCIRKYPGKFYLWNPSTRIFKKLPEIANGRLYVINCGFGWDESSGEYKVFARFRVKDSDSNYSGRLYSSKTQSWKTIEHKFTDSLDSVMMAGAFVGGKLHWKEYNNDIIFLDLKSEVFGRIELPFEQRYWYDERLGQIGGCLCLVDFNHGRDIRVWVMKDSWERLVDLSLDHELLQRPFSASSFTHKGSNGEILLFLGSTLLVYHPRENEFRLSNVCRMNASHHVYVESLVSPEDA